MNLTKSVIAVVLLFALGGAIVFLLSRDSGKLPEVIDKPRLVVKKEKRVVELYDGDKLLKTYKMVLGFAPSGDKEIDGDGKTPLGEFYVFIKNDQSRFFLSLGLSYPSAEDAARGLREKLISQEEHDAIVAAVNEKGMPPQNTKLGGEIYIHGGGTAKDWTWGCIALENEQMKEIFDAIPVGASVTILP